jgi:DNA polymerase-3 subunit delta'
MFDFSEIIGHGKIIGSLKRQLSSGAVTHAYVFDGETGCGARELALSFAKALLCEKGAAEPCNACVSCRTLESGNNPDITLVRPEKSSIGADEIREQIVADIYTKPYIRDRKVYVIENAELLTPAAQIVLLKTLEEAPPYCIFLLITDNSGLFLPTVLSRCALYKLRPLADSEVSKFLISRLGVSVESAGFIAGLSGGNTGKAQDMAESDAFSRQRAFTVDLLSRLYGMGITEVLESAKRFEEFKDGIGAVLDIALMWFRDVLAYAESGSGGLVIQKDILPRIAEAAAIPKEQLLNCAAAVEDAREMLKSHTNFQLTVEVMLLRLSGHLYVEK